MTHREISGHDALRIIADGKTDTLFYSFHEGPIAGVDQCKWISFGTAPLHCWSLDEIVGLCTPWKFSVSEVVK